MLDSIISLVKNYTQEAIANNASVPDEKKGAAVEAATTAIAQGFEQHLTPSNLSSVTDLFSGNSGGGNAIATSLQSMVSNALTSKVGLSSGIASGIAGSLIPVIVNALSKKVNDPNEKGFNIESMIGAVSGKSGSGILGSIGKLFGM